MLFLENELRHPVFWSVICRREIYEHISKRAFYHHELSGCKKLGEQYLPILRDKFKVVHRIPISLDAMLGVSTASSPPLLLKASPSHRRSELHLTQPRGPPEQRKDVLTAASAAAALVHAILLLRRGRERDAEHGVVQVREPLGERGAQRAGPRRELARLDVVQLEGVVCKAEDQQRGRARRKGERVRALREGREGGVVLYRVEVEDVRPSVVVRRREPLAVGAYGHACYRSWRGLRSVGGLGIIDRDGFGVGLLGILLRFGRIYFALVVVSSPGEDASFNHQAPASVLIKPADHPRGGRVGHKIKH